jgi:hypothetical protein
MSEAAKPMLHQVHIKNYKSLASVVVNLELARKRCRSFRKFDKDFRDVVAQLSR